MKIIKIKLVALFAICVATYHSAFADKSKNEFFDALSDMLDEKTKSLPC